MLGSGPSFSPSHSHTHLLPLLRHTMSAQHSSSRNDDEECSRSALNNGETCGQYYGSMAVQAGSESDCLKFSEQKHIIDDDGELLRDEIAGMTKLAVPVIITYFLEMLPSIITIILVGREYDGGEEGASGGELSMQKLHLDAASLAVMFCNIVAMSPAFGILTAMDTLCSQAHGGE